MLQGIDIQKHTLRSISLREEELEHFFVENCKILVFNYRIMKYTNTLFLFIFSISVLSAQQKTLSITRTSEIIRIDGDLSERVWENASIATDFFLNQPSDKTKATNQTIVKVTYDDDFLYIAASMKDEGTRVIRSLKRDNDLGDNDDFWVVIDPGGAKTNAFMFGLNAGGAQSEGQIGLQNLDLNWDNKWLSAVKEDGNSWKLEMAIPFKTLRFKEGQGEWSINFMRSDVGANETHVWNPVPVQFDAFDLGYTGKLIWDAAPKKSRNNIALIPYLAGNVSQVNPDPSILDGSAGLDAKVAITSNLNLDIAINPDFSQVEVDRQVTNLTRFNIFFPERRTFFLENADIFANFGNGFTVSPFFSRQIGLGDGGRPLPLLYGLRMSGNLNENSRMGLMNVQTFKNDSDITQNFTAAAYHQKILKRSVVKGMILNREEFGDNTTSFSRNTSLETDLISDDGKWAGNVGYHQSFQPEQASNDFAVTGSLAYNGRNFRSFLLGGHVGENYNADMGFAPQIVNYDAERDTFIRLGFTRLYHNLDYFFFPENSNINRHWWGLENISFINNGIGVTSHYTRLRYFAFFKNTSQLRFRLNNEYVNLQFPFSFTGGTPLPAKKYNNTEFNVQANTDLRKKLNGELFVVYGTFYEGTKLTYIAEANYREQPWGNFGLSLEQNYIKLAEPYGEATFTLVGLRAEISFTNNLFWTTFLQYNTQANNFNLNSRLQWRFAPMSDFYLVYTDNQGIDDTMSGLMNSLYPKNRALVAKVTYWLNL